MRHSIDDGPSRLVVLLFGRAAGRRFYPARLILALVGTICSLLCPVSHADDCNGNGVSDEVDVRTGASEDCNQNVVPDECESMPLRFAEVPHLPSAGVPLAVTTGDFNSDGLTDFASASVESGVTTVTVFLGNGEGDFVRTGYPGADHSPSSLKTGDLDGDGDDDLVLLSSGHLCQINNNEIYCKSI